MINFDFYDQEKLHRACLVHVDIANPGMPVEKIQELAASEEIQQEVAKQFLAKDLAQYFFDDYQGRYPMTFCTEKAKLFIKRAPEEILINIQEWLRHEPLSDIKICNVSIKAIMDHFKSSHPVHFLQVVECLSDWKENEYYDNMYWFHYFARM